MSTSSTGRSDTPHEGHSTTPLAPSPLDRRTRTTDDIVVVIGGCWTCRRPRRTPQGGSCRTPLGYRAYVGRNEASQPAVTRGACCVTTQRLRPGTSPWSTAAAGARAGPPAPHRDHPSGAPHLPRAAAGVSSRAPGGRPCPALSSQRSRQARTGRLHARDRCRPVGWPAPREGAHRSDPRPCRRRRSADGRVPSLPGPPRAALGRRCRARPGSPSIRHIPQPPPSTATRSPGAGGWRPPRWPAERPHCLDIDLPAAAAGALNALDGAHTLSRWRRP